MRYTVLDTNEKLYFYREYCKHFPDYRTQRKLGDTVRVPELIKVRRYCDMMLELTSERVWLE